MFNQPLIVAKPPWWRRSLLGWNPWGWRSMALDQVSALFELATEGAITADGYYRPGDGYGGRWILDLDKPANGGSIIDPGEVRE